MQPSDIIELLKLEPLQPEGGYFRRAYSSAHLVSATEFFPDRAGKRHLGTSIYYLVTPDMFSTLHRVDQDELFHFYLGDAVEMMQLTENGELRTCVLGPRLDRGENVLVCAPGGTWQGTRLKEGGKWALLGTTCVPGFDFADFQMASRDEMVSRFPQHDAIIRRFTRTPSGEG